MRRPQHLTSQAFNYSIARRIPQRVVLLQTDSNRTVENATTKNYSNEQSRNVERYFAPKTPNNAQISHWTTKYKELNAEDVNSYFIQKDTQSFKLSPLEDEDISRALSNLEKIGKNLASKLNKPNLIDIDQIIELKKQIESAVIFHMKIAAIPEPNKKSKNRKIYESYSKLGNKFANTDSVKTWHYKKLSDTMPFEYENPFDLFLTDINLLLTGNKDHMDDDKFKEALEAYIDNKTQSSSTGLRSIISAPFKPGPTSSAPLRSDPTSVADLPREEEEEEKIEENLNYEIPHESLENFYYSGSHSPVSRDVLPIDQNNYKIVAEDSSEYGSEDGSEDDSDGDSDGDSGNNIGIGSGSVNETPTLHRVGTGNK